MSVVSILAVLFAALIGLLLVYAATRPDMKDPAKSDKVMREVVKMTKLDIATMQKAAA